MPSFTGAWFIARKDVTYLLMRRETLMWTFLMPIVFFYFIGTVTGGMGGSPERRDRLAVRGADGSVLSAQIASRLQHQSYDVVTGLSTADFAKADRRLTIPAPPAPYATFTEAVEAGVPQALTFEGKSDPAAGDYDQVRILRAAYEVLADFTVITMNGRPVTQASFDDIAATPRALTMTVKPAGHRALPPAGFAQAVPGTLVMFTMLVLLTSGAVTLVMERDQGLLRRLASAPMSPGTIVLGKWLGRLLLAFAQIAFAMVVGRVLFHMNWGRTLPMVLLVMAGWAAFTASLAIVLASITRTTAQTSGIGVFATQVLAALGGCWWPIEITPPWMRTLALFTPTGWSMDALHKLVAFGDGAAAAIPHVAALFTGALILGWVGTRVFRYQ